MTQLIGILDAIKHDRPSERGTWLVGEMIPDRSKTDSVLARERSVAIKGVIPGQPSIGGSYRLTGEMQANPPYGQQFCFTKAESIRPASIEGIRRYLDSALPHVGPTIAAQIVDAYGEAALDVLDAHPERLLSIRGINEARLADILTAWRSQAHDREATVELHKLGLTQGQLSRIVTAYHSPSRALDQIRSNPYSLIDDVPGIGWARADHLGDRTGITYDDPRRARAAAYHLLSEAAGEGHTYLPQQQLIERARGLDVTEDAIVEGAIDHSRIFRVVDSDGQGEDVRFALESYYQAEAAAAAKLQDMLSLEDASSMEGSIDSVPYYHELLEPIAARYGLDPDQRAALVSACQHGVSIITGGPGTGKTTSVRAILDAWEALYRYRATDVALASPTGKAAQRLSESTGREAKTIHRLLEWSPRETPNADGRLTHFRRNSAEPLECKALVIDEASMLDCELLRDLCDALTPDHRLLLVGDIDQLPSVGPGAVLRDLIDSGVVPTARLSRNHRQEKGSFIGVAAQAVNRGEVPTIDNSTDIKYYRYPTTLPNGDDVSPARTAQAIADGIVALVASSEGIAARLDGIDPFLDVQVLCPGKAGACGTVALNQALQAALNPPRPNKPELRIVWGGEDGGDGDGSTATSRPSGERILRLGDRVIQTRNDYELEVFNGDVGVIVAMALRDPHADPPRPKDRVTVAFDDGAEGRLVVYDGVMQLYPLHLAYALTVHKSQGSEYPVVLIPVHTTHAMLLKRNLIYTAITRARDWCVILGTDRAMSMAARNNSEEKRFTFLGELVKR